MGISWARKDVFISYARWTNRAAAKALHDELGEEVAFLDLEDIPRGASFPVRLRQALLDSRVFVALVNDRYFDRWYCAKEWRAALAAADARSAAGAAGAEVEAELDRVIVLRADSGPSEAVRDQLPGRLALRNLCAASDTREAAKLVRRCLSSRPPTLRERLQATGALEGVLAAFDSETRIPPPRPLHGRPILLPDGMPRSLGEGLVGRDHDLKHLHRELVRPGHAGLAAAMVTVHGCPGLGKTRLALEYLWRYGPRHFTGGVFWIDAARPASSVRHRQYEIACALGRELPPWEQVSPGQDLACELAGALRDVPARRRVLFVLDNVPVGDADSGPPALEEYCPDTTRATVLATSRARPGSGTAFELRALAPATAVSLLRRQRHGAALTRAKWRVMAEWVGGLPWALEVLRAVMDCDALEPAALYSLARARGKALGELERLQAVLGRVMGNKAPPGIARSLALLYDALGPEAQEAARVLSRFQSAPVPDALLNVVCAQLGGRATRALLISLSVLTPMLPLGRHDVRVWDSQLLFVAYLREQLRPSGGEASRALDALARIYTRRAVSSSRLRAQQLACLPALRALLEGDASLLRRHGRLTNRLLGLLRALWRGTALREPLEVRDLLATTGLSHAEPGSRRWADWQKARAVTAEDLAQASGGKEHRRLLSKAVTAYGDALRVYERVGQWRLWSDTQNGLGTALRAQAQSLHGSKAARVYSKAARVYRKSLRVHEREDRWLAWAHAKNNLGNALRGQATASSGSKSRRLCSRAVQAYVTALRVYRDRARWRDWAATQCNLGTALRGWAETLRGERRAVCLAKAVCAYRSALQIFRSGVEPRSWAMTQNNLGNALGDQAVAMEGAHRARLHSEAVGAYGEALKVYKRETLPQDWAETQLNLADERRALARVLPSPQRAQCLREAIQAVKCALRVRTAEAAPALNRRRQRWMESVRVELGRLSRR